MNFQHKKMSEGKWRELSFFEQMANVGSEAERAINWKNKNDKEYGQMAFERFLELIDLTIADKKNIKRLLEITRVRENFIDYFSFGNQYGSSEKSWKEYFYSFAFAVQARC